MTNLVEVLLILLTGMCRLMLSAFMAGHPGAFLIPYFVILVFGALPLFFMELVLAWSFYYLVHSLTSVLPWSHCNNDWNTELCQDEPTFYNQTHRNSSAIINVDRTSPAQEFFERKALGLQNSHGLENLGPMRNELVFCLMAVFILIYLSLWKGVKTSGKVVWVTATMPYLVLAILFVRGLFLPGSLDGIFYYLIPNLSKIGEWQVWIDAAVQIFFSVGAGFGVHIALASYNKTHHNCYRDCLITACVNSATSLFAGFVIFSYLGYMATRYGREISTVATEGPGLVFVVYPEAIATLPGSVFWSIIFFIMLITLGIDSAMGGLEALLTGISDVFRVELKKVRFSRELLTLVVVVLAFLFALPNVSSGGVYLVTLWDVFATGPAILFGVLMEAVAVSWFYGLNNFCADIQYALGFYPSIYWRICWKYISPLLLLVMILSSIIWFEPLRYMLNTKQHYVYPGWANVLGWMITSSSIIFIPLTALYLLTCKGRRTFRKKLALNISPYWEHEEIENGAEVTRFKHMCTFINKFKCEKPHKSK
ncbi:hypothetical protein HELRODRAFT_166710 [Helobdella robusta]|uniref:Transporter n=1 Tax=Helobdella robusta TaxID=6412 RepID=T1EYE6_HELRO|nr:hypothetical protein HELRODRAFT_166710 [Helobdella robusta]ESO11695.1 hypothetical protein HELRODRAFT_166710 [Helobdella robusta]